MPKDMESSRGPSSKRRDKFQDQQSLESRSFDRSDSNRGYQNGDQHPASVLASLRGPLERLANIAKCVENFRPEMAAIEADYGGEIDRETEIQELNNTVEKLTLSKGEKLKSLERENASLKAEQEECRQEKEKFQTAQDELRSRSDKNDARREQEHKKRLEEDKTKTQKHIEAKTVELEAEFKAKVRDAQNESKKLRIENEDLKKSLSEVREELKKVREELKKVREELKNENRRDALALKRLDDEYASLAKELEQVKSEFPVEGKPVDYYLQNFQGIHNAIRDTSSRYFSKCSKEINIEVEHQALREKNPIFESISLLDTDSASFVRVCVAQHVISSSLCEHVWQPFLTEASDSRHAALNQFLDQVSERLAASKGHGEGAWRALTLRGIDAIAASSSKPRQADVVVEEVLGALDSLISIEELDRFKEELKSLIKRSISTWELARKDERRIRIQREPDPNDRINWHTADSAMAGTTTDPTLTSLCLFPHVSQRSQEGKEVLIHPGSALFPSSYVWTKAMLEKKDLEEETERMVQALRSKVNMRRPSGPASPMSAAEGASGFMALKKHEYT